MRKVILTIQLWNIIEGLTPPRHENALRTDMDNQVHWREWATPGEMKNDSSSKAIFAIFIHFLAVVLSSYHLKYVIFIWFEGCV